MDEHEHIYQRHLVCRQTVNDLGIILIVYGIGGVY